MVEGPDFATALDMTATMTLNAARTSGDIPVIRLGDVGSTMDEARGRLAAGDPAPFWIMAESQSGGRGRHGRAWHSPQGNLYATLALSSPCEAARGPELGFVAGVALHRAVADATGLDAPDLAIKWPNDLLLGGAKTAGLLVEGMSRGGRFDVLIGFGVNVAHAPFGTPYPATALHEHAPGVTVAGLLEGLSRAWMAEFSLWRTGFAATRAEWLARAAGMGRMVRARPPSGEIAGIMRGIDENGCLLIEVAGQNMRIEAGDVFL